MKFVSDRMKHYWKLSRDFCVYRILHADDPPHRLALGIAIGIFVTFLPLIGLQMLLSVLLAWICRANKLVGVPLVWISNPFTMVPIYYPCYMLGCKLLGRASDQWQEVYPNFISMLTDAEATWGQIFHFCWTNLLDFVAPLFLGSFVVASTLGVLAYYVSLYAIRSYRLRRFGQLMPPSTTPEESIMDDQVADVTTVSEAKESEEPEVAPDVEVLSQTSTTSEVSEI